MKFLGIQFIILHFVFSPNANAQNSPFEFQIPTTMKLIRIDTTKNDILFNYQDTIYPNWLQKIIYPDRSMEYNYGLHSINESYHAYYDSLGLFKDFGHRKNTSTVSYSYYSDGSLSMYSFSVEDTTKLNYSLSVESFIKRKN
jgi:hypothetical protein